MSKIEHIKKQVDIIQLAIFFGFEFNDFDKNRLRAKENLLRVENTSSLDFFADTQKFFDRGEPSIKDDCIDLVCRVKNLSQKEAIHWLRNDYLALNNTNNTPPPQKESFKGKTQPNKKESIDFKKLEFDANDLLNTKPIIKYFSSIKNREIAEDREKFTIGNIIGNDIQTGEIWLNSAYHKLFEKSKLDIELLARVNYVFNNFIGYSKFWNAPTIILKDYNQKIVDVVFYRPQKPEHFTEWNNPKYIYKNFNNRGDDFLYPFEFEMERLIIKNRVVFIGEGLKNSLNALIFGIPFISLESASNKISANLEKYLNLCVENNIEFVGAFDGDESGFKVFEKVKETIKFKNGIKNIIEFDSGLDFSNLILQNVRKNFIKKIEI